MSNFQVVITLADGSDYTKGGLTFEAAQAMENAVNFALEGAGAVWDESWQVWVFDGGLAAGGREVEVLVVEDDEEDGPFLSEYERGWANVRADERAAVERQNAEDALTEQALGYIPTYMGVRGRREPDGTYIFEP